MKSTLLFILSLAFISCGGSSSVSERKPVAPAGSDGDMPWNVPVEGQGHGALGQMMSR